MIISNATRHQRMIICAICICILRSKNGWIATSTIYHEYYRMASIFKPLKYRRFSDMLVELENIGLVTSHKLYRGRDGHGKEYQLKFPPEIVGPAIDKRWWNHKVVEKLKDDELDEQVKKTLPGVRKAYSALKRMETYNKLTLHSRANATE